MNSNRDTERVGKNVYLAHWMINHDVVGLDISVHDSHAVTGIQRDQQLVHVITNIVICQGLIQFFKILVVDIFEYKSWNTGLNRINRTGKQSNLPLDPSQRPVKL